MACTLGCGGGGAGPVTPPPPPPPPILVIVTPDLSSVLLGGTVSFTSTVSNTTDTVVLWSVNQLPGGSAQVGTITADGIYTAPADLPPGGVVQVTATSHADKTKSGSAQVSITSDIFVSVAPGLSHLELGASQSFTAAISSKGKPDMGVQWSLAGPACPSACGTINASGIFTAPGTLPASPGVTVVATSVADPSKQSSAAVSFTSSFTLQIVAPSSLQTGVTAAIVATLTPVPGSNPNSTLSWALSGSGCAGSSCGVLTVTTTQSGGGTQVNDTATYTAPSSAPQPDIVLIAVTPLADPTKQTEVSITIEPGTGISLLPGTETLAINHRFTLSVGGGGASGGTFLWSVNGIAGGSGAVGSLCVVGSNPCQGVTNSTATQVDYVAPGAIPAPNPVTISAANAANPSINASSQVTIINHLLVSVSPPNVTLPPLATQTFAASVLGTSNLAVMWQLTGQACAVSGACGTIDSTGLYTAPPVAPTPDSFQVLATSQDDPAQSGAASLTISSGANLISLHPASIYAGGTNGFVLRADGSGFVPTTSGAGSTLIIGGTARVSTCNTANSCSAPVNPGDVAQAESLSVLVRNPDSTQSNLRSLIVISPSTTESVITLSSSEPASAGNDIVVVEPTTAGLDSSSADFDISVAALGLYLTASNTCNLAGNPIPILRPASGVATADVCLFTQSGFDTSMSYSISGPGDISVIAKQPASLGIIHLTLQIPATAQPGARTLFIQNSNLDRTAASGALDIQ